MCRIGSFYIVIFAASMRVDLIAILAVISLYTISLTVPYSAHITEPKSLIPIAARGADNNTFHN